MSKKIDLENPESWSDDDKEYLFQRGRLPEPQRTEYLSGTTAEAPQPKPLSEITNTGDVATDEDGPSETGATGDEELSYEEMTARQLKAAAKQRGLSTSGTKEDLIERLEADDESGEEDEESEEEDE